MKNGNAKEKISIANENIERNPTLSKEVIFERKNRKLVFAALLLICVCVNFDNGIVPAASKEIKELLEIDDQIFGLYGSLSFFGCLIGKKYFIN